MQNFSSAGTTQEGRADREGADPSPQDQSALTQAQLQSASLRGEGVRIPEGVLEKLRVLNEFAPSADDQLMGLLAQTLLHMTEEDLAVYIERVTRFDKEPVSVLQSFPGESLLDFSSGRPVYWWHLRRDLAILPKYFDTSEVLEVSEKEATSLLFSLVESLKYDFGGVTNLIETLTTIMESCAERSLDFQDRIPQFKDFLHLARQEGDINRALGIVQLGIAAGMTIEQSVEIVTDIYNGRGIPGYVFRDLYDELNALRTNAASGDLIFHSLKTIVASGVPFSEFTQFLYVAATHTNYDQNEILEQIFRPKANLAADEILSNVKVPGLDNGKQTILDRATRALMPVYAPDDSKPAVSIKDPSNYFPDSRAKSLRHGILPYRATRSLEEGLQDLHALMKAEYQEGAWIFDQQSDTWFSLGGRTNLRTHSVRHEFFPYDISALSLSPMFIHIHPEKNEVFIRPHRDSLAYTQLQDKVTKFLATMPSGSDFKAISDLMNEASRTVAVKGLIVTSIGLTELIVPNDPCRIAELAMSFRRLKDQTLSEFDARGYFTEYGIKEPDVKFVKRLLGELNKKLPPGFEIIVHAYNE